MIIKLPPTPKSKLSDLSQKPLNGTGIRLPEGYTIGWENKRKPGNELGEGYTLRDPKGKELGFFLRLPGKESLAEILKAHIALRLVTKGRERVQNLIVLEDSEGKEVGSWDPKEPARDQIQELLKFLRS